MLQLFVCI